MNKRANVQVLAGAISAFILALLLARFAAPYFKALLKH